MQPFAHLAWTPGREKQKSRNLYWQDWVCHAEESDVRGEMSVFMPKSDSHCISPNRRSPQQQPLWDVNTMKKNPCNRSCRCQSVWHEKNLKRQKTTVRSRLFTLNPISTDHDSVLQVQYRQSIFCTTERTPDSILPARVLHHPPSLTSVHHEKIQTTSVCHCQNVGHEMIANKAARREISIVTPAWYFHWHFPAVKLQNIEHLAQTTSNRAHVTSTRSKSRMSEVRCLSSYRSQIPTLFILSHSSQYQILRCKTRQNRILRIFRVAANPPGSKWTEKQMWDLGLDSRIGLPVTLSHLHNATHWTSGLNTWQRQQENPEKL